MSAAPDNLSISGRMSLILSTDVNDVLDLRSRFEGHIVL